MALAALLRDVHVDATTKGFPAVDRPLPLTQVGTQGWSLADLQPPVMTLRESALAHNLELMATYCRERAVELAPHGKTTMAPQLWSRQLDAGAWGITAATAQQARVMAEAGVSRILIANEVVDPAGIAWLAARLQGHAPVPICYVDSRRGLDILETALEDAGATRALPVLVELGHKGGRTGCRSVAEALDVAGLVAGSPRLVLAGVAGYEGTICADRSEGCTDLVRAFIDDLRALAIAVLDGGHRGELLVSAGGSAFFDLVVERLRGPWPAGADVRVLLRSGCYLTHDALLYERLSPFSDRPAEARFHQAIEVWGSVLSLPEPEVVIVGLGRRDVPFDHGVPVPSSIRATDGTTSPAASLEVTGLNDQHAFCRVNGADAVGVGDLVGFRISHPCTAFDKWRVIPVLDDEDVVVDAIATYF